ncbi:MAG: hypothetical protein LR015_11020 [Verrucomicrobia bacterium]|nr:hypothetical protein [Verrucomicrobiota bacterium]
MQTRPLKIVVSLPMHFDHFRRILRGVQNYATSYPELSIIHTHGFSESILRDQSSDGFLAVLPDNAAGELALRCQRPIINLSNRSSTPKVPKVVNDDFASGALAAKHLLQCEYQRFYYFGNDLHFSGLRKEGFCFELQSAGHTVQTTAHPIPQGKSIEDYLHWRKSILAAVRGVLSPGAALFFCHQ